MLIGSIGLIVYGLVTATIVRQPKLPVWLGAGMGWIVWLAVTFVLWLSLDGNFWRGGRTSLNDVESPGTLQSNSRVGATASEAG